MAGQETKPQNIASAVLALLITWRYRTCRSLRVAVEVNMAAHDDE